VVVMRASLLIGSTHAYGQLVFRMAPKELRWVPAGPAGRSAKPVSQRAALSERLRAIPQQNQLALSSVSRSPSSDPSPCTKQEIGCGGQRPEAHSGPENAACPATPPPSQPSAANRSCQADHPPPLNPGGPPGPFHRPGVAPGGQRFSRSGAANA